MRKNAHPVYGVMIRTNNLLSISTRPGLPPEFTYCINRFIRLQSAAEQAARRLQGVRRR